MPKSPSNMFIHIIFSTKERRAFLTKEIRPELILYMVAALKTCESPALIIECVEDHVHILCALSGTWAISELVEDVRKKSSKWIKTKGSSFQEFQWQEGYAAFTVGRTEVPAIKDYIATQEEHHQTTTFQEEYRKLITENGLEYDERDMWD